MLGIGLVLGLAIVYKLAHFTFCHTNSPQKPASPKARILPIAAMVPIVIINFVALFNFLNQFNITRFISYPYVNTANYQPVSLTFRLDALSPNVALLGDGSAAIDPVRFNIPLLSKSWNTLRNGRPKRTVALTNRATAHSRMNIAVRGIKTC